VLSLSFRIIHFVILFLVLVAALQTGFAEEPMKAAVEIFAAPKSGKGPMRVYLEPKVNNLKGPLKFHWYFGDGKESEEMIPKPHYYGFGKYNLMLEVTDMEEKTYTAGVNIDAALPG
jgi:hypothetical protein